MTIEALQWVSEWRIELLPGIPMRYDKPDNYLRTEFRVTNGGVYTPTSTLLKAETCMIENIYYEKSRYIQRRLLCRSCKKEMHEHHGSIDYERCLYALAQ